MQKLRRAARHDLRIPDGAFRFLDDVIDMHEIHGNCRASQAHFAKRFGVSDRSVRNWEKLLIDLGYLVAQKSEKDGRRRHLKPGRVPKNTGNPLPVDTGNQIPENGEIPENPRHEIPENERQALIDIYTLGGERDAREAFGQDEKPNSPSQKPSTPAPQNEAQTLNPETKTGSAADPKMHPAVVAYRTLTGSGTLADMFALKIARAVGEKDRNLEEWREHVAVWVETPNWNHRSVPRMLEAFAERGQSRHGNANGVSTRRLPGRMA